VRYEFALFLLLLLLFVPHVFIVSATVVRVSGCNILRPFRTRDGFFSMNETIKRFQPALKYGIYSHLATDLGGKGLKCAFLLGVVIPTLAVQPLRACSRSISFQFSS